MGGEHREEGEPEEVVECAHAAGDAHAVAQRPQM